MRRHKHHEGITAAITWLEAWATASEIRYWRLTNNDERFSRSQAEVEKYIGRLSGASGKHILAWLMGCAFLREQRPWRFKSDHAWDCALSQTLFRRVVKSSIPRSAHPSAAALTATAEQINSTLGPLLQNAAKRWLNG